MRAGSLGQVSCALAALIVAGCGGDPGGAAVGVVQVREDAFRVEHPGLGPGRGWKARIGDSESELEWLAGVAGPVGVGRGLATGVPVRVRLVAGRDELDLGELSGEPPRLEVEGPAPGRRLRVRLRDRVWIRLEEEPLSGLEAGPGSLVVEVPVGGSFAYQVAGIPFERRLDLGACLREWGRRLREGLDPTRERVGLTPLDSGKVPAVRGPTPLDDLEGWWDEVLAAEPDAVARGALVARRREWEVASGRAGGG